MLSNASHNFIEIYCDGSCDNKVGRGGIGILLRHKQHEKKMFKGCFTETTSARMEIFAATIALEQINKGFSVVLYCDNQYVVNTIEKKWLQQWMSTGMLYSKANPDLWMRFKSVYDRLGGSEFVTLKWVRGHNGNVDNEIVDKLANQGRLDKNEIKDRKNGMVQIPIRSI